MADSWLTTRLRHPGRCFAVVAASMLVLDQVVKMLQRSFLPLGTTMTVIPGFFYLRSLKNRGAAFSILEGQMPIFFLVAAVMAVFLIVFWRAERPRSVLPVVSTALIAAGGVGNLIDRVVFGGVYDLINVTFFPFAVFNIADLCMTLGVIAFALWFIFFDGLASLSERRGGAPR
ncbi:MAG: signal peptidase II [Actinomycetia bacterium]|nr:signal peptidase II [Actinomycetes bacterium]